MRSRECRRRQPGTVVGNRSTAIHIETHPVPRKDVTRVIETGIQHRLLEIDGQLCAEQLQTALGLMRKFLLPQTKHRVRRVAKSPLQIWR